MVQNTVIAVVLTSLLSVGCGGAGPTGPTLVTGTSLADQIRGTFKGQFQSPSHSSVDYQVVVTKIDDHTVRVSPASGSSSSTFDANLDEETLGYVTSITLKAPSDGLENNGTFVSATGRLAYSYWFDSASDANIEVFSGTKQ